MSSNDTIFETGLKDDNEPVFLSDTENMNQNYVDEKSKDGATCSPCIANLVVENTNSEVQNAETAVIMQKLPTFKSAYHKLKRTTENFQQSLATDSTVNVFFCLSLKIN